MSRAAQLFRQVHGLDQGTGDIISFESNEEMSLETATETVIDIEGAIASLEQQAQVLDDVAGTLGVIAASLESTTEYGGAYPNTVWYANLAVEAQLARINESMEVISHESVGGALTRVEATQAASSSIGDKLKALWERIVAALRTAWDHIVKFFRSMFTATGQLKRRAQKLLDEAHQLTVTEQPEGKLKLGALVQRLSVEGKLNYPMADALLQLSQLTWDLAARSVQMGTEQANSLSALLHRQSEALFKSGQMYHVHVGKFTPPPQFKKQEHGSVNVMAGMWYDTYLSPMFPGERQLSIRVPRVDLSDASHYAQHPEQWVRDMNHGVGRLQISVVHNNAEVDADAEIDRLSVSQIEDIARAVIDVAESYDGFMHDAEGVHRKAEQDLRQVTTQVTSEQGLRMFSGYGVIFGTLVNTYGRVARQLLLPATAVSGLTLTISTDFLKVAEHAFKDYQPQAA